MKNLENSHKKNRKILLKRFLRAILGEVSRATYRIIPARTYVGVIEETFVGIFEKIVREICFFFKFLRNSSWAIGLEIFSEF